jgi:hypothetical protein
MIFLKKIAKLEKLASGFNFDKKIYTCRSFNVLAVLWLGKG